MLRMRAGREGAVPSSSTSPMLIKMDKKNAAATDSLSLCFYYQNRILKKVAL